MPDILPKIEFAASSNDAMPYFTVDEELHGEFFDFLKSENIPSQFPEKLLLVNYNTWVYKIEIFCPLSEVEGNDLIIKFTTSQL